MQNIFKKAFLIIVCIIGIMISGMTVSAAVYRTTTSRINLRSKAGTLSSDTIICTIPKGAKLQLIGKSTKYSNWYYTEYKGKTGFVEGTYLRNPVTGTMWKHPTDRRDILQMAISPVHHLRHQAEHIRLQLLR